jgi:hypothetical protein
MVFLCYQKSFVASVAANMAAIGRSSFRMNGKTLSNISELNLLLNKIEFVGNNQARKSESYRTGLVIRLLFFW